MITIYTKTGCVQCSATENVMNRMGITYQLVDLDTQPDTTEQLQALGFRQLPVVITQDDRWSGFRPDKIAGLHHAIAAGT